MAPASVIIGRGVRNERIKGRHTSNARQRYLVAQESVYWLGIVSADWVSLCTSIATYSLGPRGQDFGLGRKTRCRSCMEYSSFAMDKSDRAVERASCRCF